MPDEIKKISEIIDDLDLDVTNIQDLATTPKLTSDVLKQKFDTNVANLITAIDGIGEPVDHPGLIESIQSKISAGGNGNMDTSQYATGVSPSESQYPVDRALYADTANTANNATKATYDAYNNNIEGTYLKKTGGTISGNLSVGGIITGGHQRFRADNTATSVASGQSLVKVAEITNLNTNGLYLAQAYFGGTASASGGGSTQFYIYGNENAIAIQTHDNSRDDMLRAVCLSCFLVGPNSASLRISTPNAYGWNNVRILFEVVRIA